MNIRDAEFAMRTGQFVLVMQGNEPYGMAQIMELEYFTMEMEYRALVRRGDGPNEMMNIESLSALHVQQWPGAEIVPDITAVVHQTTGTALGRRPRRMKI